MLSQSVTTTMALALILAGQPLSAEGRDTDLGLRRNVQRAVESSVYFSVFDDVQIDIDDEGIVVLTGHVTARNKRVDIASRVSSVSSVVGVQNDLDVLPASQSDNELRYLVARSIYGSSTFWHYVSRRNPPIHIVVENGRVTLTGLADSEADRAMAEILASNAAARSLTNNLKVAKESDRTVSRSTARP